MKTEKKTFVLVHGGWHGGWCWKYVAADLRSKGHTVLTPTLTGSGERAHLLSPNVTMQTGIDDVVGVFEAEELDGVSLVGHSAGAPIVAGVADRLPERISSLIWLDGVILQDGESLRTYFTPQQEEAFQMALEAGSAPFPPPPPQVFGIPSGADADWVGRRLTAQPFRMAADALKLHHPLGNGLPCSYIACMSPTHPFVAASHNIARANKDWQWRELDACHDAMITSPQAVAAILEQLA
jgi:pimeloyl-ACP methyl ester carboxylesterase